MSLILKAVRKGKFNLICLFKHDWRTLFSTGKTNYDFCVRCEARKIEQTDYGHQPIDTSFLTNEIKEVE